MVDAKLRLLLYGEDRSLSKSLTGAQKATKGFQTALVPATAVLGGLATAAFKLRDAGEESATSNARLAQVFKSMGDATGTA